MTGKPTIPEVLPLLRAYRARIDKEGDPLGEVGIGGVFHVITDDCNNEQQSADWVLGEARRRGFADEIQIAEMLSAMSSTQRRKLYRIIDR